MRRMMMLMTALAAIGLGQSSSPTKAEKKQAASERVVKGTVTDGQDNQINGAVVQLKDMRTMQVRSFITQQNGEYHFSGLKVDNDYQLEAKHDNMTSGWKTLSIFDTRKEPILNLKVDKAEKKEDQKK
jgi:Carboxypeptidase regulatory-like domain